MTRIVLMAAIVGFTANCSVWAQSLQKLDSTKSVDFYMHSFQSAVRVGAAAMVKIFAVSKDQQYAYSHRVLISCDGRWISTTFFDNVFFQPMVGAEEFAKHLSETEPEYDRLPIDQTTIGASRLKYAENLAKRAAAICKVANREPRNVLVPLVAHADEGLTSKTTELVTGTFAKVGREIDVWLRTTEFRKTELKNSDGSIFRLDDKVQYLYERTNAYTMRRTAFDCEQRKLSAYEIATYTEAIKTPTSDSIEREKLKLSSAVPGSVGEAQLDWVCALYATGTP